MADLIHPEGEDRAHLECQERLAALRGDEGKPADTTAAAPAPKTKKPLFGKKTK